MKKRSTYFYICSVNDVKTIEKNGLPKNEIRRNYLLYDAVVKRKWWWGALQGSSHEDVATSRDIWAFFEKWPDTYAVFEVSVHSFRDSLEIDEVAREMWREESIITLCTSEAIPPKKMVYRGIFHNQFSRYRFEQKYNVSLYYMTNEDYAALDKSPLSKEFIERWNKNNPDNPIK